MGQANKRGTFEQRQSAAIERNKTIDKVMSKKKWPIRPLNNSEYAQLASLLDEIATTNATVAKPADASDLKSEGIKTM